MKKNIRNYIRDAMLGLIVGDALGVPVEFKSREYLIKNPVNDMIGFGTYNQPPGTWSDDSSLALCMLDALKDGYDLNRIAEFFVKWYEEAFWTPHGHVFDIGNATRVAIKKLKDGISPLESGGRDERSNGNGSLMRILPLVFFLKETEEPLKRFEYINEVSGITHAHIRSVLSCHYYLDFADQLLKGKNKFDAYETANTSFIKLAKMIEVDASEKQHFDRLLSGNIHTIPEEKIDSTGYVIHTLEASLWCILTSESYMEAVLKSVNLGIDTDTTAAVTGGLEGMIWGADEIPEKWLKQIARLNDIESLLDQYKNSTIVNDK